MKTLLQIQVDGQGIGKTEYHVNDKKENDQLAVCLMSLMAKSEGFKMLVEAVVHCCNEHTDEVREAVEKSTVPLSEFCKDNTSYS